MSHRPTNLPARRTRLIARESDVAAIRDLVLHADGRLVTLKGAGGVGKTSLALEVGRQVASHAPDGVWIVELADVRGPVEIVEAVRTALGFVDQAQPPDALFPDRLAAREALIILDSCEHLSRDLAPLVDELLDHAPDLRILATSRRPLRVRGEVVYQVPPLRVPAPQTSHSELSQLAAVQLFVERAKAARSDFSLTMANGPLVASICRRLDGLPLAIELAAAQVASLGVDGIDRLLAEQRLLPLDDHLRPARQQTMAAALEWSYRLLTAHEQTVFRTLAVFSGGWTLEAAEQVCATEDGGQVPPALAALVEHSLVVNDLRGGSSRYRFLVPVAEYATQRLADAGEADAAAARQAAWAVRIAARRDGGGSTLTPDDLARLDVEHENCLAGLRWAIRSRDAELAAGLSMALVEYWGIRGELRLMIRHVEATLELLPGPPDPRRLRLELALAVFRQHLGDQAEVERLATAAVATAEASGNDIALRTAWAIVGDVAAAKGDVSRAREAYARSRDILERSPDWLGLGVWHANMGEICLLDGSLEEAEEMLSQACHYLAQGPGAPWYLGQALVRLTSVARRRGDFDRAEQLLGDALDELTRFGAVIASASCLVEAAQLASRRRDASRAATLLGAASILREAAGFAPSGDARTSLDEATGDARSELSPDAFDAAFAAGRAMSLDQAAAFAKGARVVVAPDLSPFAALTRREREVAQLVAEGLTNADIAQRLLIAPGTARIHVERIREKLGCTSRVQVAGWVLRQQRDVAEPASSS